MLHAEISISAPAVVIVTKVDQYFGANFPWFGVVGNHDAETSNPDVLWLRNEYNNGNNVRTPLKNIFTTRDGPVGSKETTYSWDYGNAHFIVLNCYWDGTTGANADSDNNLSHGDDSGDIKPALLTWLQEDLALTINPLSLSLFTNLPSLIIITSATVLTLTRTNRDAFWALLESDNVSAVFCGHPHYYFKHRGGGGPAAEGYPGHTYCYSDNPNDWRTQDPNIDSQYGKVWEISTGNAGEEPGGIKASPDGSCNLSDC